MTRLASLIAESEDRLLAKMVAFATQSGHAAAVALPEEWRSTTSDISNALLKILQKPRTRSMVSPVGPAEDLIAALGAEVARRQRTRGVSFENLFDLMKCYRLSYLDLLEDVSLPGEKEERARSVIERFFDRMERGGIAEWMERCRTDQLTALSAENDKKIQEISSLYRMSNTMLSTIRLNKLIHLLLTALTTGDKPFFDRAILFLINERSSTMQGMLGVTRETATGLINPDERIEEILATRWDISEEDMLRQQDSEFSRQVRASRLDLDKRLNIASLAVLEKKLLLIQNTAGERNIDADFVRRFGIKSCAIAPLMAKEQVVGVIIVDNTLCEAPITTDDLRFLQLVTNQAGMAIENSILYNRIEDANRSLREARERLVQGERLSTIGEMAASIAHEVKGPLVSIGGFARRLEKSVPADSSGHSHAATIVREVERLEKLLTNILSFARKTTICYASCNIGEIIDESLAIVAPALDECRIRVHTRYPPRGIALMGDCQQLKQVFLNLFANAQEAMRKGGDLHITVGHARLHGKKAVSVKICDTGGGVPLHALHNIFNSFFTTKDGGTGLGLSIANRIVVNHGGKIQLTNRKGVGAEFNVILPITP